MNDNVVTFKKDGPIGIISLNRPDRNNAITAQTAAAVFKIREDVGYNSEISVLILTSGGKKVFSIGTAAEEYASCENREEFIARLQTASIIGSFDRPVIAAINGDAFGQGLELVLACDLRISSESANFAMPHVSNGEIPWDGGTQRLARLVGRSKALEMILGGECINAREALRIGLVNDVVSPDDLMPTVLKTARDMAGKGPIALRYAKEAIHKGMDMTLEQGLRLEADLYFLLHTTEDRTEGITAFREKRNPHFEGK